MDSIQYTLINLIFFTGTVSILALGKRKGLWLDDTLPEEQRRLFLNVGRQKDSLAIVGIIFFTLYIIAKIIFLTSFLTVIFINEIHSYYILRSYVRIARIELCKE